ncbi:MAG TPA: M20 family metallopeptidase [Bryobacteraceae bacterium]|nr:M20 family metallopeptidase [Bryobacteraceae bacterium]
MQNMLAYAQSKQNELISFLQELVECESPSDNPAAISRFVELFASRVGDIAKLRTLKASKGYGPHVLCEFKLPGRGKDGQILALGHSDTVYPLGTLASMPWREDGGRLRGPGVLDMKAGVAFFVYAMRGIIELDRPVRRKVVLQLNSDEEVGSPSSRALTEEQARQSRAVLVLEPGTGLEGKPKTARKGIGDYTVRVHGKAAHAGVDFSAGASAIVELARQIEVVAGFTGIRRGLTVNPGVITGGTRSNVIAAEASAEIDFRVERLKDADTLAKKFSALKPLDKRCRLDISGGLNRPPMERSRGGVELFRKAQALAREIGISLEESSTGGGSDGNFTAALGIPTLDGIGAVGVGAHSPDESILIDRIADRTAVLAGLVTSL